MSADDLVAAQRLPGQSARDNLTPLQACIQNKGDPFPQDYVSKLIVILLSMHKD